MKVLDLFAGIGGFTIGLEKAGLETVAFCEIEPYAQKVLKKNWPEVPIYDDVRSITAERLISDGIRVDVITGGFPCQDISTAGRQAGLAGERSGLWSECARLLGEIRPRYAIFENVTNLLNGDGGDWFKRVLGDISALGYDAEWHCIPASELGAHHHRDRIWIIAYPQSQHRGSEQKLEADQTQRAQGDVIASRICENVADADSIGSEGRHEKRGAANRPPASNNALSCRKDVANTNGAGQQQSHQAMAGRSSEQFNGACVQPREKNVSDPNESRLQRWLQNGIAYQAGWEIEGDGRASQCGFGWERYRDGYWSVEPDVGRVVNGLPNRAHRLKCLGNAVVPPIPELIGRAIAACESK